MSSESRDFGSRRQIWAIHAEALEAAHLHIQPVEACDPPAR